jgi:hypothetical protein
MRRFLLPALAGVAAVAAVIAVTRGEPGSDPAGDAGPVHVHGLGINPRDGALFVATHTGTWRVAPDSRTAERVGDSRQDTMGFTVAGPDHFLGSGHPDLREAQERGLPSQLGLIESRDAGRTWEPISLLGEADFHVLRFGDDRVYGYDASNDRLLVSDDEGRSWDEIDRPAPIIDLAVHPGDSGYVVATTEAGLYESRDGGGTWDRVGEHVGLLAWPSPELLHLVDGRGDVHASSDAGRSWRARGSIGGLPAALLGRSASELYAALHDGTVKQSVDGGLRWTIRSSP